MTPTALRVFAVACALVYSAPAAAQSRVRPLQGAAEPRVTIGINGGYQSTTREFDDRFTFELNRETGTTRVRYPIEAGFLFDAGAGVRLWRGLGAGIAVSRFVRDGTAATDTSLPHPLFLDQDREVTGEPDGIEREETAVHVHAQYQLPLRGRLQVTIMGGPSVLQVNQELVTEVSYTEEYPFDTATFTGVEARRVKGSATGFNAGVDVRWLFSRWVGVGALVRYAKATIDLDGPDDRTVSVDAGGAQLGAGLRLAF